MPRALCLCVFVRLLRPTRDPTMFGVSWSEGEADHGGDGSLP